MSYTYCLIQISLEKEAWLSPALGWRHASRMAGSHRASSMLLRRVHQWILSSRILARARMAHLRRIKGETVAHGCAAQSDHVTAGLVQVFLSARFVHHRGASERLPVDVPHIIQEWVR